jgi:hypothetical protein
MKSVPRGRETIRRFLDADSTAGNLRSWQRGGKRPPHDGATMIAFGCRTQTAAIRVRRPNHGSPRQLDELLRRNTSEREDLSLAIFEHLVERPPSHVFLIAHLEYQASISLVHGSGRR